MGESVRLLLILVLCVAAWAHDELPSRAHVYAPVLAAHQAIIWPDAPEPWTLAGLVEQESCITLKHYKCWNPRAELKMKREYGFGFGQITTAYRDDGSERFNKFNELVAAHRRLRDWQWEARFDAVYQLIAMIEMTRSIYGRIEDVPDGTEHLAMMLSAYNGGMTGVHQDRMLCATQPGCDPNRWFGHVETHSVKSRKPQALYGYRSWFDINRDHVRNVMRVRRGKYRVFWGQCAGDS